MSTKRSLFMLSAIVMALALPGCDWFSKESGRETIFDKVISISKGGVKSKEKAVEHGLRHGIIIAGDKVQYMPITERMSFHKAPAVSIAVINEDKLEWAKGYGCDTNTLFQAGSVSKPVAALGALLLVQQGRLSFDEDVNKYLKSWKVPENNFTKKEKVTLRRLLSHTAGMTVDAFPGYSSGMPIPSVIEILDGKKPHVNTDPVRVTQTPGKEFRYSGGGLTIVQLLIEDVTGEKFDVWMKNNILIPFGMNVSTFSQPLTQPYSNLAVYGHDSKGKPVNGNWHIYPEMAAAGLWTTPTDLARLLAMILRILHGNQIGPVNKEFIKEALTIQFRDLKDDYKKNKGIGLGFFLDGSGAEMSFGHGGGNEGFRTQIDAWPELGKGLVIMVNKDAAEKGLIGEIKRSIADAYGLPGLEPIIKNTVKLDPLEYPKFTGVYKYRKHTFTVSIRNNALFLLDSRTPFEMQLYPAGENRFFVKELTFSIQFLASKDQIDRIIMFDQEGKRIVDNDQEIVLKKEAAIS